MKKVNLLVLMLSLSVVVESDSHDSLRQGQILPLVVSEPKFEIDTYDDSVLLAIVKKAAMGMGVRVLHSASNKFSVDYRILMDGCSYEESVVLSITLADFVGTGYATEHITLARFPEFRNNPQTAILQVAANHAIGSIWEQYHKARKGR